MISVIKVFKLTRPKINHNTRQRSKNQRKNVIKLVISMPKNLFHKTQSRNYYYHIGHKKVIRLVTAEIEL